MKEGTINRDRTVVAHHQAAEVAEPGVGAFDDPRPLVALQRPASLCRGCLAVRAMRRDQFDASPCQPFAQGITVVGLVGDHPRRLLPRSPRPMSSPYSDCRERRFREPDFRGRGRVKVLSQRKTAAADHHHPLRPLPPLLFPTPPPPFFPPPNPPPTTP